MCFSTLSRTTHRFIAPLVSENRNLMQKRFTHRASSFDYLKIWKDKGVNFLEKLQDRNISHFPHLVERIFKVETSMKMNGLVPFVHAMPAGSCVPTACNQFFYENQVKHPFFQLLRPKNAEFMLPLEDMIKEIPKKYYGSQKSRLLSMSYAFTCSVRCSESAASRGFVNHQGKEYNSFILRKYEVFLKTALKDREKSYFDKKGWRLIRHYSRLSVGDFIMIGVPLNKLSRWVYDCKPYNVPTRNDVHKVSQKPQDYWDDLIKDGHQATLLICDETLDPSSGLVMVKANDEDAVKAYCGDNTFKPMKEVSLYQEMLKPMETGIEQEEQAKRKVLNEELSSMVDELREAIADPKKVFDASTIPDEDASRDVPPVPC